jgi:hypothetical protein
LSDLSAGGGPDQIAGKCDLERPGKAAAVDKGNRRDRNVLDRGDQRQRVGHQRLGFGLVEPHKDRDIGAGRERVASGSEHNGSGVARGRPFGCRTQIGDQSLAEQVERRVVDHDLP